MITKTIIMIIVMIIMNNIYDNHKYLTTVPMQIGFSLLQLHYSKYIIFRYLRELRESSVDIDYILTVLL